jgi:hypothetical protein
MKRLFIFGIGGSGARVIRSLVFLLAGGIKIKDYEIFPIIIDPDERNGDKMRTIELLKNYHKIYEYIKNAKDTDDHQHFFYHKINPVSEVFKEELEEKERYSDFEIILEDVQETFKEYLRINNKDQELVIKSLYSQSNLDLKMDVGFKGNPHIGSVVLNQIYKHKRFKEFTNKFHSEDRIFLINSIFGGTGSAGFPLLLKTFRDNEYSEFSTRNTENAIIGGLTLLPYFRVKVNENSEIDSKYFISRIIPALRYYNRCLKNINVHYFLGDESMSATYENFDGDKNQKNPAHIVEFLGALSIIDFLNKEDTELTKQYKVYQFQFQNQKDDYNFKDFPDHISSLFIEPLSQFFLLYWSFIEYKIQEKQKNQAFFVDTKLNNFLKESIFINTFIPFLEDFGIWLKELYENKPGLKLFNLSIKDKELDNFIIEKTPKKRLLGIIGKKNIELLIDKLNKFSKEGKKYNITDKKKFIYFLSKIFYQSTLEYYQELFHK